MRQFTHEEFIADCQKIHNNRYDYSLTQYVKGRDKITIICPEHGSFLQIAQYHRKGGNCPKCAKITSAIKCAIAKPGESFGDLYPDLVPEWSSENSISIYKLNPHTDFKGKWICKICGFQWIARMADRAKGKGCRKCKYDNMYKGGKYISGQELNWYKCGAIKRGIVFEINIEYIEHVLEQQDFKCNISGVPIAFQGRAFDVATNIAGTASIDRIDSKRGYSKGNIQIIHKFLNMAKGSLDDARFRTEFDTFARDIVKSQKYS